MSDNIVFVWLRNAAAETPWCERHLYRVLTEPRYSYLDPRPKIRRLADGNKNVLVRSEWEPFKERLAEDGLKKPPKRTKLMKARRQARLEREQQEAATAT